MQQVELLEQETFCWPAPQSREVALFTDLTLLSETLELAAVRGSVNLVYLQQALRQRLQRMRQVKTQQPRTIERILRELKLFGWIEPLSSGNGAGPSYRLTSAGVDALRLAQHTPRQFRRLLAEKMQEIYVIPGWFIARLWHINPQGQGEVILPLPPSDWQTRSRGWDDHGWDDEMRQQTVTAAQLARKVSASAFPIDDDDWLRAVEAAWRQLGVQRPRGAHHTATAVFSPRTRLTSAFRSAWLNLLFNRAPYKEDMIDFPGGRPPLYPRTFAGWCPRLESLELIFYTDAHPKINGRLLFPVSVFRKTAPASNFEPIMNVLDPEGDILWLHQPTWDGIRERFVQTLIAVHQQLTARRGTLYVSLLAVRDEVCRQLRISSVAFDEFLGHTLDFLPATGFPWSIAVETDVREDQASAPAQYRRPVYVNGVPHFLLGLAHLRT